MIILIQYTPEPTEENEHFEYVTGVALWPHHPPPMNLHLPSSAKTFSLEQFSWVKVGIFGS
jgi:hypothetical protein